MAFEYERKEYQDNLENIKRIGTYQDYENAIYEMNVLRNNLQKELGEMFFIDGIASVIDQVDNLYYGDIAFHTTTLLDKSQACLVAGNICGILSRYGEKCYDYSLYYNQAVQAFMYTKVVIQVDNGPNLYDKKTKRFVVR